MYGLNISINIFNEINQEHLFKCVVREFGINQRVSVHGCGQSDRVKDPSLLYNL